MNKSIILKNKLELRFPSENDVDELVVLKNNSEASKLLGGITPVYTKEGISKWIEFHNNAENEVLYVISDCNRGVLIGHVGLYNIDLNAKKAEFGILIADNESYGKGYGSVCLEYMIDYAFVDLKLNKLSLSYLNENKPAEKLYLKYGFEREGVLKQEQYKNNRYYDVVLMAKFNPEKITTND